MFAMGNIIRKQKLANRLAIFGGSFDPIHYGHLWIAKKIPTTFSTYLCLIPNGNPPHRQPLQASWQHRVAMCKLATKRLSSVQVSTEESPEKRRYTIDTLAAIRHKNPKQTLLLFIGTDAFATLDQWHQWHELFRHAHIIVIARQGTTTQPTAQVVDYCKNRYIKKAETFSGEGGVYLWKCNPPIISSTDIRYVLRQNSDDSTKDSSLMLPAIKRYCQQNALYLK